MRTGLHLAMKSKNIINIKRILFKNTEKNN